MVIDGDRGWGRGGESQGEGAISRREWKCYCGWVVGCQGRIMFRLRQESICVRDAL